METEDLLDVGAVAVHIGREVEAGDEIFAWRLLSKVLGYLAEGRVGVPVDAPPSTGRRDWDTLIAALVGDTASRRGIDRPSWTTGLTPLEGPFTFAENELVFEWTRRRTPAFLASLNIWIEDRALAAA